MGIYCETDIQTPPDGVFLPGSPVTGVIRYTLDGGTLIDEIIISLKGVGNLEVTDDPNSRYSTTYCNKETYVFISTIVKIDETKHIKGEGHYETEFNFILPDNIPSSLNYNQEQQNYKIKCKITYNVRAKFMVSGMFAFNKKFAKEIQVLSTAITPTLPMHPNIHGQRRKLFQPFSKSKSIVNIKATIQNSVILPGGKVEIAYEVQNDTNIIVTAVKTKLVETYDFLKYKENFVEINNKVKDLETKTGAILSRGSFKSSWNIVLPPNLHSTENTKLFKKRFGFIITVVLPVPFRNLELRVPLQIGNPVTKDGLTEKGLNISYPISVEDVSDEEQYAEAAGTSYGPPPSYWQSIKETSSLALDEYSEKKFELNEDQDKNNDYNNNEISKKL